MIARVEPTDSCWPATWKTSVAKASRRGSSSIQARGRKSGRSSIRRRSTGSADRRKSRALRSAFGARLRGMASTLMSQAGTTSAMALGVHEVWNTEATARQSRRRSTIGWHYASCGSSVVTEVKSLAVDPGHPRIADLDTHFQQSHCQYQSHSLFCELGSPQKSQTRQGHPDRHYDGKGQYGIGDARALLERDAHADHRNRESDIEDDE